ncbi:MAG: hypothetical protein CL456_08250 [Acidimicrobiaceae bacterium]|nr:hypothetical protein [Acidimicrobiaceae bacterium]
MRAIVLAAGKGSRMLSTVPKPLHLVNGVPMARHILKSLEELDLECTVVVVGHQAPLVSETLRQMSSDPTRLKFAEQRVQRGTADATKVGLQAFASGDGSGVESDVLVLPGDMPLLTSDTLIELQDHHVKSGAAATLLTAEFKDPSGYGRIVRDERGRIERVVEHVDAGPHELAICEVNTSIYCFNSRLLDGALQEVESSNSQNEYYLTDVVGLFRASGHLVTAMIAGDPDEMRGVNDEKQLVECETLLRARGNVR